MADLGSVGTTSGGSQTYITTTATSHAGATAGGRSGSSQPFTLH
jgi:hypothetical protein